MISPRVLCLERRSWSTLRNSDSSSLKDSIFDLFTWPPARDVSPFKFDRFCARVGEVWQ